MKTDGCAGNSGKHDMAKALVQTAIQQKGARVNLVWLEATGCSGNIISFLNSNNPNVEALLATRINLAYNNSLMVADGEQALTQLFAVAQQDFILAIDGAVATKAAGLYNSVGRYRGEELSALQVVQYLGERAKHILAVGTCAAYGGISAARPNPAGCISVAEALRKPVIRLPGCPCHPDWVVGTLAFLLLRGEPPLDQAGRPKLFYGTTIHDRCTRRSYFDQGIFAEKLGQPECMFRMGCCGPVTRTDCPIRRWNGTDNWPIGANTPCIGCAHPRFPDGMEPFVSYLKGGTNGQKSD